MSDNIRTALYDASYACALASRASAAPPMLSRVVGRHCESGDIVVRHAYLPSRPGPRRPAGRPGHRRLLPVAGQRLPNHVYDARPWSRSARAPTRTIVRRETLDDLFSLDVG